MASTRKVGVAVCGMGKIGSVHLNHVVRNPRTSVKWLVEEDLERAVHLKNEFYMDDSVQIVNASKLNKVLEDKTTAVTTAEEYSFSAFKNIIQICNIVERIHLLFIFYFQDIFLQFFIHICRHFDPSIRDICKRVKAGELGEVKSIKTTSRDHLPPPISNLKTSGGIFFDSATHDMDLICWILGESPSTLYCQAHAFNPEIAAIDDFDQIGIMMKFPGGAIAHIDINRQALYGYDQRLEVFGSNGMLESKNMYPTSVHYHSKYGHSLGHIEDSFTARYKESYRLEFEHFLNVYQGIESTLDVSEEDCIRVTRLSECCRESLQSGKPIQFKMS
ncbi:uncharacterized oxidoreductase YrbE-like [Anneissia japonica]|uniref:uncharacterized oxidoreductase YrbE-like n=1 Tax=Anneissia japonica TaxID=1529436 RepID=UPI0014258D21|nr:uncharacterized oxidoreductase YrbE-like [Anneissia japonica]